MDREGKRNEGQGEERVGKGRSGRKEKNIVFVFIIHSIIFSQVLFQYLRDNSS